MTKFHGRTKISDLLLILQSSEVEKVSCRWLGLAFDRDHWHSTDSVLKVCISTEGLGLENIRPSAKSACVLCGRKRMWQSVCIRSRTGISNS